MKEKLGAVKDKVDQKLYGLLTKLGVIKEVSDFIIDVEHIKFQGVERVEVYGNEARS